MISYESLRIIFVRMRPQAWVVLLVIGMMLVMSILEGFGLGLLLPIFQQIEASGQGPETSFWGRYTAVAFSFMGLEYSFLNLMLFFIVIMLLKFSVQACLDYQMRHLSATMKHQLRQDALENLLRQPMPFYHRRAMGDLIATVHSSSDYGGSIAEYLAQLVSSVLTICVYITLQMVISPSLTLIGLCLMGLSYLFIVPRFRATSQKGDDQKGLMDKMVSLLHETLGGIRIVRAFNREEKHFREFVGLSETYRWNAVRLMKDKVVASLFMEPYSTVLVIIIMFVAVVILKLELAILLTFFVVFSRLAPRFKQVNAQYMTILEYLPHLHRVHETIIWKESEICDPGSVEVSKMPGDIRFEDVWFRYAGRDAYVLHGVSVTIERFKTTALVGASGAGKTTVVDLLLKNLKAPQGVVRVGNYSLADINTQAWLSLVGIVEQEPFLFRTTIAENIRYGKPDAGREEIEEASRLANAHDFITTLPQDYQTMIGDRGATLSVGQKQRIALARALIRDPELLILDEATSALDSESERLIQESLATLVGSKTILIIAHRLSFVVNADQIILLENGRVQEAGSHSELVKHEGSYARNYRLQTMTGVQHEVSPKRIGGN